MWHKEFVAEVHEGSSSRVYRKNNRIYQLRVTSNAGSGENFMHVRVGFSGMIPLVEAAGIGGELQKLLGPVKQTVLTDTLFTISNE